MDFDTDIPDSTFEKALMMQNMITALGTGGSMSDPVYLQIRSELISDPEIKSLLPSFVRTCRDGGNLWAYLKSVHEGGGAYAVRRQHVNDALRRMPSFYFDTFPDQLVNISVFRGRGFVYIQGVSDKHSKPFPQQ